MLTIALLAGILPGASRAARPARGKHDAGTIVWRDEQGRPRESVGGRVRFGWYERRRLSVPRDGRTYVDEDRQARGVPLASDFVGFTHVREVRFSWEPPPQGGLPRLVVRLEMVAGGARTVSGFELQGVQHPRSPYVAFVGEDGVERRIEVPLRPPPEGAPPSARVERIVFPN